MQVNLKVITFDINEFNEKMFVELFDNDSDFSENEEYFREDTLKLGFENESERCSKEMFEKFMSKKSQDDLSDDDLIKILEETLEECVNICVEDTQFIVGNSSYTQQYKITINYDYENIENGFNVVISYISKS